MKAPIVINDSSAIEIVGDLRVYASVEQAERSLEHWDVADANIYVLDAQGMRLRLVSRGAEQHPAIEPAESAASCAGILTALLTQFLGAGANKSLDELLALALQQSEKPYSG